MTIKIKGDDVKHGYIPPITYFLLGAKVALQDYLKSTCGKK